MFKTLNLFLLMFSCYVSMAQTIYAGFLYGKNYSYTSTLLKAASSNHELQTIPQNEFSFLLQDNVFKNDLLGIEPYSVFKNNSLSLEFRLIERQTSYHEYMGAGFYLYDGNYHLKNWEILANYFQCLFTIKEKLSFDLHLSGGYSHLFNYQLRVYNPSTLQYYYIKPGKTNGIIIGYGLNISYLAFNRRVKFYISCSLSHLSIIDIYNIDNTVGIFYNIK